MVTVGLTEGLRSTVQETLLVARALHVIQPDGSAAVAELGTDHCLRTCPVNCEGLTDELTNFMKYGKTYLQEIT